MRNLYDHHFTLKPGTRVYIPTDEGRTLGEEVRKAVERLWTPPSTFFHFAAGGHVAAARSHRDAEWLASLDLQRFFDQISRTKVHRALKAIGIPHADAWEMSCNSTVDKHPPGRQFSLPFGFVQSPLLASVVLAQSALGRAIRRLRAAGLNVTIYVDDITISGQSKDIVSDAVASLRAAASLSGFTFNPEKTQPPSGKVVSFNIEFGSGTMTIVEDRMAEFEVALRNANEYIIGGILGYVASVNVDQVDELTLP